MTELRRRMIQDMELRGLKENTQRAYVDAVKDLARHYKRSPDRLSEEELRQYFVGLKDDKLCPACFMRDKIKNKPKGPLVNDSEWAKMAGLK